MPRAAINRELSFEEQTLLKWLLNNGIPEAQEYSSQIPALRIVGGCECGCPTVIFALGNRRGSVTEQHRIIANFYGATPEGTQVGVLLHALGDQISELEVYLMDDAEGKFGLPAISSLHPFETTAPR
jgi:hypothetical protein